MFWVAIGLTVTLTMGGVSASAAASSNAGGRAAVAPVALAAPAAKAKPAFKVKVKKVTGPGYGRPIAVRGKVRPKVKGVVKLQQQVGKKWRTIGSDKLNRKGKFTIPWTPDRLGGVKLRVTKAGNKTHRAGKSKPVGATVTNPAPQYGAEIVSSAYTGHACDRRPGGALKCWGYNDVGQLGTGSATTVSPYLLATPQSALLTQVVAVAIGEYHTCAVVSSGQVRCVGYNNGGQLGVGNEDDSVAWQTVPGVGGAVAVTAGEDHSCALIRDGSVLCWGENESGQLGNGSTDDALTARRVLGISNAIQISASYDHTCAVLDTREVRCWGYNEYGQVGDGSVVQRNSPVKVVALANVAQVEAGEYHTCARLVTGMVKCWGHNGSGGLGDGTEDDSSVPVTVVGLSGVRDLAVSPYSTCALTSRAGRVSCWGYNFYGELGNGTNDDSLSPVSVPGANGAQQLTGGYYSFCVQIAASTAKCWGRNGYGNLGNGTTDDSNVPVPVSGL